jgi:hypothetical protein
LRKRKPTVSSVGFLGAAGAKVGSSLLTLIPKGAVAGIVSYLATLETCNMVEVSSFSTLSARVHKYHSVRIGDVHCSTLRLTAL